MTSEKKIKVAQGLFFGLFFLWLGDFMKGCAGEYYSVKKSGEFVVIMGGVIIVWGLWQCLSKPK